MASAKMKKKQNNSMKAKISASEEVNSAAARKQKWQPQNGVMRNKRRMKHEKRNQRSSPALAPPCKNRAWRWRSIESIRKRARGAAWQSWRLAYRKRNQEERKMKNNGEMASTHCSQHRFRHHEITKTSRAYNSIARLGIARSSITNKRQNGMAARISNQNHVMQRSSSANMAHSRASAHGGSRHCAACLQSCAGNGSKNESASRQRSSQRSASMKSGEKENEIMLA